MFIYLDKIETADLHNGIVLKVLGHGDAMSVVHWNLQDGAVVERHHHPQEQFGFVIRGGFEVAIGDRSATLKACDSYFVPSNVPHRFVAIGETEAIDVFSPQRDVKSHYTPV
jgi:quercetin dioxygenase-like cupin family protein